MSNNESDTHETRDEQGATAAAADTQAVAVPVLTMVPGGVADPDQFIRESTPPVLVRVQFSVYDREAANYRSWPYVRFGLTLPSAEMAAQFRDDMDAFVRGWVERGGKA